MGYEKITVAAWTVQQPHIPIIIIIQYEHMQKLLAALHFRA